MVPHSAAQSAVHSACGASQPGFSAAQGGTGAGETALVVLTNVGVGARELASCNIPRGLPRKDIIPARLHSHYLTSVPTYTAEDGPTGALAGVRCHKG